MEAIHIVFKVIFCFNLDNGDSSRNDFLYQKKTGKSRLFFVIRNLWFPPYMCCSASCRLTFEVARCLSFLAPKSLREQHMSFAHWEISFQKSSNPVPRLGFFFMKNESYSQIILYLRIWFLSNFWLLLIFFSPKYDNSLFTMYCL